MSKGAGATRGGKTSKPAVKVSPTEQGLSKSLKASVLSIESKIRNNTTESAYILDKDGNVLKQFGGDKKHVNLTNIPENSIITHNHPTVGKKGFEKIGNSFSHQDVATAVYYNASEIRAVTPTYTFSMKRPKGGWGVTEAQV